jgi:hypothetical protein
MTKTAASKPLSKPLAALKRSTKGLSDREVAALFKLIRTKTNAELQVVLGRSAKKPPAKAKTQRDSLVQALTVILQPILARAAEKADLLMDHLGADVTRAPKGLSDAVRVLRRTHTDEAILEGAKSLLAKVARRHSMREVVT